MHVDEEHFRKLERLYQGAPINQYFRPTLWVSNGAAELSIPVLGRGGGTFMRSAIALTPEVGYE